MARTRRPGRQIQVRRKRRQTPGKFKLHKPVWIDPYPFIAGTEPEKRIFAALMAKRIYFIFQGQVPELTPGTDSPGPALRRAMNKETVKAGGRPVTITLGLIEYIPDFVLPEYKVILDPFSPFHHSQPGSVIRDTRKVALYNALGYEYYHPWALANGVFMLDQPQHNLGRWAGLKYLGRRKGFVTPHTRPMGAVDLLDAMPQLLAGPRYPLILPEDIEAKRRYGYRIGSHLGAGATSVAAANHKRRRPPNLTLR